MALSPLLNENLRRSRDAPFSPFPLSPNLFFPLFCLSVVFIIFSLVFPGAGYLDNPYHNWYHAVDCMQTVSTLLTSMDAAPFLNSIEKLALCLSALAHDLRHPGLNQLYQINARTPLALLYNDQSVLEHHHASSFFRLAALPANDVFANLTKEEYTVRGIRF